MNFVVAPLVAALLLPTVVAPDLGGYVERSAHAEYSGEQLVTCDTPDGPRDSVFDMAQTDGIVMAWSDSADAPLVTSAQGMSATVNGGEIEATAVEGTTAAGDTSPNYEIDSAVDSTYLGRDVLAVSILRDGIERLELTVDTATDAVVRTRSFGADGLVYCDRRMLEFAPGSVEIPDLVEAIEVDRTRPLEDGATDLPESMSGFVLTDTYPIEEGTLSYYSDGYFSVGVVVSDRHIGFDPSAEVEVVEAARGAYRRSFEAGRVTVTWNSAPGYMAVIGDLPPDLLEEVLAALPTPADPGFFGRMWNRLFG